MKHIASASRRVLANARRSRDRGRLNNDRGSRLRDTLHELDCRLRNERDLLQRERLKATMAIIRNPQRTFGAEFIARQVRVMARADTTADGEWLRDFHRRQKQKESP